MPSNKDLAGTRVPKCSDLKSVGTSGAKACNCCREAVLRSVLALQAVDEFIAELGDSAVNGLGRTQLVFGLLPATTVPVGPIVEPLQPFPAPKLIPKVIRLPKGVTPVAGGIIVAVAGAELLESLAAATAVLTALAMVQDSIRATSTLTAQRAAENCATCVARAAWKQSNPIHREIGPHRTRK